MRVIITGGTGELGSLLARSYAADNHEVIVLSRYPDRHMSPAGVRLVKWDARTAAGWGELADGAGAIINLAGETIGGEGVLPNRGTWSDERRRRIRESRWNAGQAVVAAVERAGVKPGVVFQVSGIDYYPAGNKLATEGDAQGSSFPTDVIVNNWEPSTAGVEEFGVRRVIGRNAPVLSVENGPLAASVLQFRLFAGGRLGSGKQWFTWIHPDDFVGAVRFLVDNDIAHGVFNMAAPENVTNAQYTETLGKVMGRPALIPVPAIALKTLLGEVSSLVLDGRPVSSEKLRELGYEFRWPRLEPALHDLLGK